MPSPWVRRAIDNDLPAKELSTHTRPAHDFPYEPVAQRVRSNTRGDCFTACVATLTGIDIDLLPVMPPEFDVAEGDDGWSHVEVMGDRWDTWAALLDDNGYWMEVLTGDVPGYRLGIVGMYHPEMHKGHAVAVDKYNRMWEPTSGQLMALTDALYNGWVPITFTTIKEK